MIECPGATVARIAEGHEPCSARAEIAQHGCTHGTYALQRKRRLLGICRADLEHSGARDRDTKASDPFAVVVGAAHVQRLSGKGARGTELVTGPQGMLGPC